MRFLLDEDVNPAVADIGRGLGLDVISVHEIRRHGFDDESQLRYAAADHRMFVTRNRDDFIKLTVTFFHGGDAHFGVLIIPHSLPNHQPALLAHALHRWHERLGGDDASLAYVIDFLSSGT
jgi:predicted nuclease of predicted toxin-antitoxin system